jgi:hypothetical protein
LGYKQAAYSERKLDGLDDLEANGCAQVLGAVESGWGGFGHVFQVLCEVGVGVVCGEILSVQACDGRKE